LFKPWPYFAAAFLLLGAALLLRMHNWRLAAGLLVSGLLHEFALFFLAPASEYRYSAWMMVTVILAAFILCDALMAAAFQRKRLRLLPASLPAQA
jgi:phosphotransferase system  glucose/maltose/N-acetylglucosamine-specific IIC component